MENKIDKIITLADGNKYMIVDQGNYNGKCYFMTSKLDNEGSLTDTFSIVEETIENGESILTTVKEEKLLKALATYFKDRINV